MNFDRRGLLVLAPSLLATRAFAAAPKTSTISGMRADFGLLTEVYDRLHPGLDRYLGRDRFKAMMASQAARLAASPCLQTDIVLSLARVTAAVRCGHSHPNPANQSRTLRTTVFEARNRVPFAFRWINGQMIVTRPLRPDVPLLPGTTITAIDETPCPILLRRLMPLARADGSNDAIRVALMEIDGQGRYNAFDVFRPLISTTRSDGRIRLGLDDGRTLDLPAMTDAERKAASGQADENEGWTFTIHNDVGVLTMPTWGIYDSKWDWQSWLNAAFDRLVNEKARGLVIDLRANEGGLDCGDAVLARLIDRPLALPVAERRVRYRKIPDALRPVLDTWDRSFDNWGEAARPSLHPGFYRLVRGDWDIPGAKIEPAGKRFSGKVAVLVGPTCSSATFQFAQVLKQTGLATLVGEPTGGNRRGINGGAFYFVRLPETGIEVDLPLIGFFPNSAQPDAGVIPDVLIAVTVSDIAAGRDPAMEKARQLTS